MIRFIPTFRCISCNEFKRTVKNKATGEEAVFSPYRSKLGHKLKCKDCMRAYHRKWYRSHKKEHRAKIYRAREQRAVAIRTLKESTPCMDCGKRHAFYQMQFDHRASTDKAEFLLVTKKSMTDFARAHGPEKVAAELAKCDLVCANCHATRTYLRKEGKLKD